jgi:RNA polymerase sigma factor (TIGR02999 family)
MQPSPGEVTLLLQEVRDGGPEAEARLITLIYSDLRRVAASYLRKEAPNHTLQPTALVHEAYLRLTRIEVEDWESRSHFFAVAAKIMRNILVDHARAQHALKRGQGFTLVGLDEAVHTTLGPSVQILALDEALGRLAEFDPRQSRIVELRFFSGLNEEETGQVLGISARTVKRDWRCAKAWLFKEMNNGSMSVLTSRVGTEA